MDKNELKKIAREMRQRAVRFREWSTAFDQRVFLWRDTLMKWQAEHHDTDNDKRGPPLSDAGGYSLL
jgi:hypothetical protein